MESDSGLAGRVRRAGALQLSITVRSTLMSEAELHVLRARLIGGQLNKARRGELSMPTPLGYVVGPDGKLMLDPDEQVQGAVRLVFETFQRTGSAGMVVRYFHEQEIAWPQRVSVGPRAGTFVTGALGHRRVLQILHNPRYAGAYVYGRTRQRKLRLAGQPAYRRLPREEWTVFLPNAHPGYISWEQYEANQATLLENAQSTGGDRRSAPREGVALLQGLVLCGRCGDRMTVGYTVSRGHPTPHYSCQRRSIERAESPGQRLPGAAIDSAVSKLVLETVTPASVDVAVEVFDELRNRAAEVDRAKRAQIARLRRTPSGRNGSFCSCGPRIGSWPTTWSATGTRHSSGWPRPRKRTRVRARPSRRPSRPRCRNG